MLDTWSQKKQGQVVWAARGETAASQIVSMLIIYREGRLPHRAEQGVRLLYTDKEGGGVDDVQLDQRQV